MCTVIITGSASLRVLNVGGNPIGDDGISLMVDHLHHNTTLNELNVQLCGVSAKGTISIVCNVVLYCIQCIRGIEGCS